MVRTSAGGVHVLDVRGAGKLPPLVLLHGLSSAGVHFFPMLLRLRRHVRRLIVPDLPGHGFSERPRHFDATTLQHGLFEALDAVLDERAWLFGNSLGGYGAIRYTLARRERVRGLVLASPAGAEMTPDELAQLRGLFRLSRHGDALHFIDRLLARPSALRHLYAWGLRRALRRTDLDAVFAAATSETLLSAKELRQLDLPLLLIWGKAERILPHRSLAFFRTHLPPHVELHEPHDWGHSPFLDDAGALTRRLLTFMHDVETNRPLPPRAGRGPG